MQSLISQVRNEIARALVIAIGEDARGVDPLVKPATDAKFGDYQCNVAMSLGKTLGRKPRDVAQAVVDGLGDSTLFEAPEIAGPGFINLRLRTERLSTSLEEVPSIADVESDRLGISLVTGEERRRVIVDYSSPNVAKEMHVGHLRSTVIGDVIARVIAFQGHEVIRQNHLGDWGTQFGMVILALWHLCMRKHQGESVEDFQGVTAKLTDPTLDAEARLSLLKQRARIHQDNLNRDPTGDVEFHPYLTALEPSFETLLPLYRYVSAIEKAAKGLSDEALLIHNSETGQSQHLSELSRYVAAMLQGKTDRSNEQERAAWFKAKEATLVVCSGIYRQLGVLLEDGDICGESFYQPLLHEIEVNGERLPGVVDEVKLILAPPGKEADGMRAVCREDQGAICVFLEKPDGTPCFKGPEGDALPMLIEKSDGASLYATTDIAGILYRVAHATENPVQLHIPRLREQLATLGGGLGADRVIYVVGAPQKLHFQMLFPTAHATGWTRKGDRSVQLEHVAFGSVLGEDRKMLKTRSGDSIKLKSLLDEAVDRARNLVGDMQKDPNRTTDLSPEEVENVANIVGIGAVKYADLCQNRNTDYVFSWDKMLAMQGNTAPYMLYAYARIRSIYRRGAESAPFDADVRNASLQLNEPAERDLALAVLRLPDTIDAVGEQLMPNYLCDYLYGLAGKFMVFYENCSVLKAPDAATYASRMRLCDLTARALRIGLSLLGIRTLEKM
ncbi:MAG: arginine--tRNA ligase [Phycisphaerales bacterium]|nr:arginine--tRNA ligase [Phycisphaerales bacterium]MCB9864463.1 arginine--tRNA ligase [Phycisphaerales bacterium]